MCAIGAGVNASLDGNLNKRAPPEFRISIEDVATASTAVAVKRICRLGPFGFLDSQVTTVNYEAIVAEDTSKKSRQYVLDLQPLQTQTSLRAKCVA